VSARPLISVVVPARDAGRFLGAALDSIIEQHEERWECVVIDDGSRDDTFEIAQSYQASDRRIRAYRTDAAGASAARNQGFRRIAATSQFVSFMDSDDVWLPHALETLLGRLEEDSSAIGSHGLAEFIDAGGLPMAPGVYAESGRNRLGLEGRRLVRWPLERPTAFEILINGNVLFPPGLILTRRRGYERAGPFDEKLSAAEDWDMLIRLSRLGDLAFAHEVILHYRRHDDNLGARIGVAEQAWLVRCIAFHSTENSVLQQEIARRGWRAYQLHVAGERMRNATQAVRQRNVQTALRLGGAVPVHAWRYIRGYPLPRVVRGPLSW
jgi:glycosyltransferase involved in cell wall biosynthesis